ncbi:hypothetical protein KR074_001364 [Drosophila pseudoananassae]|nr:hypothetical protein KR074_001364 [Drosophila pseudoananassae]
MESKCEVLTIGAEGNQEQMDKQSISKHRKEFFSEDFKIRMQKVILGGARPLNSHLDEGAIERFSANEVKKNGQFFYEFGPEAKIKGWIINVITFEPKGFLKRLKNKIGKEHWVNDNVVKFSKDSRNFIVSSVSQAADEEKLEVYQYLCYLNST